MVLVSGDTSSLEGGQKFSGGFGFFSVCDNVRDPSVSMSQCADVTKDILYSVARLREVTNYIDRTKCTDRTLSNIVPYLRASQVCVVIAIFCALCGTAIAAFMTFRRPRDISVYSIQARWKKRAGWNPGIASLFLYVGTLSLVASLSVYAFLFDTWIGCTEAFCDVCRYALDCTCDYGPSLVFGVIAVFLMFIAATMMAIRWFRLIGGSSVECPCSD
jgi:hypothetical protein